MGQDESKNGAEPTNDGARSTVSKNGSQRRDVASGAKKAQPRNGSRAPLESGQSLSPGPGMTRAPEHQADSGPSDDARQVRHESEGGLGATHSGYMSGAHDQTHVERLKESGGFTSTNEPSREAACHNTQSVATENLDQTPSMADKPPGSMHNDLCNNEPEILTSEPLPVFPEETVTDEKSFVPAEEMMGDLEAVNASVTAKDAIEPDAIVQNAIDPGATVQDPIEPGATVQDPTEPGATVQDPIESGATGLDAIEPGATVQDAMEPGATVQDAIEPGATVQDPIESGATGLDAIEPGATDIITMQPGTTVLDAIQPVNTDLDVIKPSAKVHVAREPALLESGAMIKGTGSTGHNVKDFDTRGATVTDVGDVETLDLAAILPGATVTETLPTTMLLSETQHDKPRALGVESCPIGQVTTEQGTPVTEGSNLDGVNTGVQPNISEENVDMDKVKFETPLRLPATKDTPKNTPTPNKDIPESDDPAKREKHTAVVAKDKQDHAGVARDIVDDLVEALPVRHVEGDLPDVFTTCVSSFATSRDLLSQDEELLKLTTDLTKLSLSPQPATPAAAETEPPQRDPLVQGVEKLAAEQATPRNDADLDFYPVRESPPPLDSFPTSDTDDEVVFKNPAQLSPDVSFTTPPEVTPVTSPAKSSRPQTEVSPVHVAVVTPVKEEAEVASAVQPEVSLVSPENQEVEVPSEKGLETAPDKTSEEIFSVPESVEEIKVQHPTEQQYLQESPVCEEKPEVKEASLQQEEVKQETTSAQEVKQEVPNESLITAEVQKVEPVKQTSVQEVREEVPILPPSVQEVQQEEPIVPPSVQEVQQEVPAVPSSVQEVQQEVPAVPPSVQDVQQEVPAVPSSVQEVKQEVSAFPPTVPEDLPPQPPSVPDIKEELPLVSPVSQDLKQVQEVRIAESVEVREPEVSTEPETSVEPEQDRSVSLPDNSVLCSQPTKAELAESPIMDDNDPVGEAPPSPEIPIPKATYNIDWDNFDENINPFASGSGLRNSPPPGEKVPLPESEKNPFVTRSKMASTPPQSPKVTHSPRADVNENLTKDEVDINAIENDVTDNNNANEKTPSEDNQVIEEPPKPPSAKKNTPKKKPGMGAKQGKRPAAGRFKPPPNFNKGASDSDEIQIFAAPPGKPSEELAVSQEQEDTSNNIVCSDNQDIPKEAPSQNQVVADSKVTFEEPPAPTEGAEPMNITAGADDDLDDMDEEFHPASEVFSDPASWDMLEKLGGGNAESFKESALARQSLYVKFDPLVSKGPGVAVPAPNSLPAAHQGQLKTAHPPQVNTIVENDDLMQMSTPPPKQKLQHPAARVLQQQVAKQLIADDNQNKSGDVDQILACSPQTSTNEYMSNSDMVSSREMLIRPVMTQSWLDTVSKCPHIADDSAIFSTSGLLDSIYDARDCGARPESPLRFDHEELLTIETDADSGRPSSASPPPHMYPDGLTGDDNSIEIVQVLKYSQADVNRMRKEAQLDYQARLLAKEQEWSQRLTAEKEQTASAEEEKQQLQAQINKLNTSHEQMKTVVMEYEKTVNMLVDLGMIHAPNEAEKEQSSDENKDSLAELLKERDQALEDLQSVETAFSDLHRRYEKSKATVESFKKNEETLKKCVADYQTKMKKQEEKYHSLKQHAEEKLQTAHEAMEAYKKASKSEIARLELALRKAELENKSLQASLDQKTNENSELTAICDELLAKVGGK